MDNNILRTVLEGLKVSHTSSFVDALYEEHPHDSMFAISRLLNIYKIPNEGLFLEDKNEVLNIEPPYIAQFASDLVVVERYVGEDVYVFKSGNVFSVPSEQFKEGCSGAVLLFEADESSGEPAYKDHLYKDVFSKHSGTILQIGLLLFFYIASLRLGVVNSISRSSYLIMSLVGAFLSNLLITKALGKGTALANRLCSIFGEKGDCVSVINSSGAKLFGIIGWAEIGLGYFISTAIMSVFEFDFVLVMVLINGISLFFIPWSIWYQKVKIGKWCPICLVVLLFMALLFAIGLSFNLQSFPTFSFIHVIEIVLIYVCPVFAIAFVVAIASEKQRLNNLVISNSGSKFNKDVFHTRLHSQPKYDTDFSVSRIVYGNTEAENMVSIISNPHCGPCAQIHKQLDRLIEYKSEDLCIQFIFLNFEGDTKRDSGLFLISAYLQEGKEKARTIFERWFSGERNTVPYTYEKYGIDIDSAESVFELNRHFEWCKAQGITGTPTVLINGYVLPPEYSPQDLLFLF